MGQAFISRRGGGNGRSAVGEYTADSMGLSFSVTGLGFAPKQIMIFAKTDSSNYIDGIAWNATDGLVFFSTPGSEKTVITVSTNSDGFSVDWVSGGAAFRGPYYWIAFEKEQEV